MSKSFGNSQDLLLKRVFHLPIKVSVKTIVERLRKRLWIDKSTYRFIEFNKTKWQSEEFKNTDSVILLDVFDWLPLIYCFSRISHFLARSTHSKIEAFNFTRSHFGLPNRRLEKIYESFGAKVTLN